jgi:lipopolysaccharide biosynthesis glycosyltransferase
MKHPIVLACDHRYAMPLATTLRSVVEACPGLRPLDFHILADGLSHRIRSRIIASLPPGSASIRWVDADLASFREFSTLSYISKITFARLLIPSLFSDEVTRVLYLDSDLLVLEDLQPLWAADLGGKVLGAVLDGLDQQLKAGKVDLPVPNVRDYFNGGVLLIDLERWRSEKVTERALDYLMRNPNSPFADQDALNVACDGLWTPLDPRWNYLAYNEKLKIADMHADQRPHIAHFATWKKPWKASVRNVNAELYDSFRGRTRFARSPADKFVDLLRVGWSRVQRLPA